MDLMDTVTVGFWHEGYPYGKMLYFKDGNLEQEGLFNEFDDNDESLVLETEI